MFKPKVEFTVFSKLFVHYYRKGSLCVCVLLYVYVFTRDKECGAFYI